MIFMPDLYVWWRKGCFLRKCFKASLLCSSLRNFSTANRYLDKMRRGNGKGRSRHFFQILKEIFLRKVVSTMGVLPAAAGKCHGARDAVAVLAEVASFPFQFLWTVNVIPFACRKRRNTHGGRRNGQLYITNRRSK